MGPLNKMRTICGRHWGQKTCNRECHRRKACSSSAYGDRTGEGEKTREFFAE